MGAVTLTGGTLNFGAAPTVTVNSPVATIQSLASILSGAGTSFTKDGVGTLALTTTNTTFNPGQISVSGGNLRIGNGTTTQLNAGNYSGNISTDNGGSTLQIWSNSSQNSQRHHQRCGGIAQGLRRRLTLAGAQYLYRQDILSAGVDRRFHGQRFIVQ